MVSRALAALGVGVWCFLVLPAAMRLADSPGDWLIALGLGVVAPVLLLWQLNRAIAHHEHARRARPDIELKERELLRAPRERAEASGGTSAGSTTGGRGLSKHEPRSVGGAPADVSRALVPSRIASA